jgi:hypothetical protein
VLISGSFLTFSQVSGTKDTETDLVVNVNLETEAGPVSKAELAKYNIVGKITDKTGAEPPKELPLGTDQDSYILQFSTPKAKLKDQILSLNLEDKSSKKAQNFDFPLESFAGAQLTGITASKSLNLVGGGSSGQFSANSYCDKNGPRQEIVADGTDTKAAEYSGTGGRQIKFGTAYFDCFRGIAASGDSLFKHRDIVLPSIAWGPFRPDGSPVCAFAVMSNEQEPTVSELEVIAVSSSSVAADIIATVQAHGCKN